MTPTERRLRGWAGAYAMQSRNDASGALVPLHTRLDQPDASEQFSWRWPDDVRALEIEEVAEQSRRDISRRVAATPVDRLLGASA